MHAWFIDNLRPMLPRYVLIVNCMSTTWKRWVNIDAAEPGRYHHRRRKHLIRIIKLPGVQFIFISTIVVRNRIPGTVPMIFY